MTLGIPDDEVDSFTIRRMHDGIIVVDLAHRFGFAHDKFGQILNPRPHGVASNHDLGIAIGLAVEHLRKNVATRIETQNNGAVAPRLYETPAKPLPAGLADIELDL